MNCVSHQPEKPASGPSQVVVSVMASETTLLSGPVLNLAVDELILENELKRRAEAITDVLTEIMDQPTSYRHWGLNE